MTYPESLAQGVFYCSFFKVTYFLQVSINCLFLEGLEVQPISLETCHLQVHNTFIFSQYLRNYLLNMLNCREAR